MQHEDKQANKKKLETAAQNTAFFMLNMLLDYSEDLF